MSSVSGATTVATKIIDKRIPVTIISGFLGSGKTTVLNRLLGDPRLSDTAVIVNEFGEIGLDHLLVESAIDQMILMDNGCLCCSIRGDLKNTLDDLLRRVDEGSVPEFGRVMIETTGLADPAPVVQTLITDENTAERFSQHAIITVVDSINAVSTLNSFDEARCQIAMADCVLISKTDLALSDITATRSAITSLNPRARIIATGGVSIDPEFFFSVDGLETLAEPLVDAAVSGDEPSHRVHADTHGHTHKHTHINNIQSASIVIDEALPWAVIEQWLEWLTAMRGPDILRVKGLVRVTGFEGPILIQGVQHVFHPPQELADWPDSDHRSRIVVIARDVPELALRRSLELFKEKTSDVA